MVGTQLPHFVIRTVDGRHVDYAAELWQRANVLLVSLTPEGSGANGFVDEIRRRADELNTGNTVTVITTESIEGVPRPSVLIADRWGEIRTVARVTREQTWPAVDDLVDTIRHIEIQCPECEGEVR